MSIVNTYKSEFRICSYDEDLVRGQKLEEKLKGSDYNFTNFSSRGLLLESIEIDLPHIFILYYQPLNLKFRELLTKIREASDEVEIILLGANEFWPGIENLIKTGLVNDFWSWPVADQKAFEMRLDQLIEKTIYKYIAEQRSEETLVIVKNLEKMKQHLSVEEAPQSDTEDVLSLMSGQVQSEAKMVEELISQLKNNFPQSDFVYLKNYPARDQLLVTRTSFSTQDYFRGQNIPFDQDRLEVDRGEVYGHVRTLLEETFTCDNFVLQPVELASEFYGFIMAVNFDSSEFLKKTARYLSINLRNCSLESDQKRPDRDIELNVETSASQFPLALSTEVSRARRLKMPVSLILLHIEYVVDEPREREVALDLVRDNLRSYDFISQLTDGKIAIVLPHCQYENAAIKAETIRRQLVARGLKTQNTPLRLCSGVSEFPSLSQDSDSLIVDAQKACAQVLVSGKNKVCLFTVPEGFAPEFTPAEL